MVTKCYFDDETFTTRNGRALIVSSDTSYLGHVKVEVIDPKTGELESVFVVDGGELKKAVDSCLHTNCGNAWGEF